MKRDRMDDVIREKVEKYEGQPAEPNTGTEKLWGRLNTMVGAPKKKKISLVYYKIAAMLLIAISVIAFLSEQYKKEVTNITSNYLQPTSIKQQTTETETVTKQSLTALTPSGAQQMKTILRYKTNNEPDVAIEASDDEHNEEEDPEEDDPSTYGLYVTCETTGAFYNEQSITY